MKKILMILTMALAATSCMDILDVAPEDQISLPMTFRCGMNGSSVTPSSMRVTMRLLICIKRI